MRNSLRTLSMSLALAATVAMSGSAALLTQACTPPRAPGFVFHSLNVKGISCPEGQDLAVKAMKMSYGKSPAGWKCTSRMSGRNMSFSCDATDHSGKHFDFNYSVN